MMVTGLRLPELTIHHLEGRRSECLIWLMEEVDLPYDLAFKRGRSDGIHGCDPCHQSGRFRPVLPISACWRKRDPMVCRIIVGTTCACAIRPA